MGGECEVRKDAAGGGGEMWRCDGEWEGCHLTYANSRTIERVLRGRRESNQLGRGLMEAQQACEVMRKDAMSEREKERVK